MFKEKILDRMKQTKQTQAGLCSALSLIPQNFNGYLNGVRPLPYSDLMRVLKYLRLSVGPASKGYSTVEIDKLPAILRKRLSDCDIKVKDLAMLTKISASSISSYINGSRTMTATNIEKIMKALRMDILPIKTK